MLTSLVDHVVGVNDGRIKGVGRVDVKTPVTKRSLDGSLNRDDPCTSEREQNLDLTRRCRKELGRRLVDGFESGDHGRIRRWYLGRGSVNLAREFIAKARCITLEAMSKRKMMRKRALTINSLAVT